MHLETPSPSPPSPCSPRKFEKTATREAAGPQLWRRRMPASRSAVRRAADTVKEERGRRESAWRVKFIHKKENYYARGGATPAKWIMPGALPSRCLSAAPPVTVDFSATIIPAPSYRRCNRKRSSAINLHPPTRRRVILAAITKENRSEIELSHASFPSGVKGLVVPGHDAETSTLVFAFQ